ncbi:hypothetical protein ACFX1X_011101 [Malus domestica]
MVSHTSMATDQVSDALQVRLQVLVLYNHRLLPLSPSLAEVSLPYQSLAYDPHGQALHSVFSAANPGNGSYL